MKNNLLFIVVMLTMFVFGFSFWYAANYHPEWNIKLNTPTVREAIGTNEK